MQDFQISRSCEDKLEYVTPSAAFQTSRKNEITHSQSSKLLHSTRCHDPLGSSIRKYFLQPHSLPGFCSRRRARQRFGICRSKVLSWNSSKNWSHVPVLQRRWPRLVQTTNLLLCWCRTSVRTWSARPHCLYRHWRPSSRKYLSFSWLPLSLVETTSCSSDSAETLAADESLVMDLICVNAYCELLASSIHLALAVDLNELCWSFVNNLHPNWKILYGRCASHSLLLWH